jgi:hypothetical protein
LSAIASRKKISVGITGGQLSGRNDRRGRARPAGFLELPVGVIDSGPGEPWHQYRYQKSG